jgi:hypothetical protein
MFGQTFRKDTKKRETEELDSRIRLFDTDTFFWLVILSARYIKNSNNMLHMKFQRYQY